MGGVDTGLDGAGDFEKNEANGFDIRATGAGGFAPGLGGSGGLGGIDDRGGKGNEGTNSGARICGKLAA